MTIRSFITWFLIIGATVALGYIGYDVYGRYQAFQETMRHDAERSAEIAQNRARTLAALEAAKVNSQQITRGFWYTYGDADGNQSVAYFDIDQWSQQENLSDGRLNALGARVASSTIIDRGSMRAVAPQDLPPTLRFHNTLYSPQSPGVYEASLTALEAAFDSGKATSDELWQLSYIYELQGDYAKRDAANEMNCEKFKLRCAGTIKIEVTGTVTDVSGKPVASASVSVLSHPEVKDVLTDTKGAYTFALSARPMEKIRISAVKRNYSEGVASVIILGGGKRVYRVEPISLGSPITIVTLDTKKHTVTDPKAQARADGSFILQTERSTYEIPPGAIVHKDGSAYSGEIDVYLYEFTRETVPQSLMTLDTFDQVIGYAGNLMQTFGMPYIQFFTPGGEELHVHKARPMLLTYKVAHMKELYENADGFAQGALTAAQMDLMVAASKGDSGFPITREFLVQNQLLTFPPFWVFDRIKGVWENVGMRVLDTSGTIQVPFYTINN